jgi:hypothetical protein
VRILPLVLLVTLAGCGNDPSPGENDRPSRTGVAVPDGGVGAGHGTEDARRATVRVPERDASPPLALIRLSPGGGAAPVVHRSPVQPRRATPVTLAQPEVDATAVIRDPDGTGRIRLTVRYEADCGGEVRRRTVHHPPSQIERIRLAPGTRAPVQRTRSGRVPLPTGCHVQGEAFADATNALGLESFSDPVRFAYG